MACDASNACSVSSSPQLGSKDVRNIYTVGPCLLGNDDSAHHSFFRTINALKRRESSIYKNTGCLAAKMWQLHELRWELQD